MILRRSIAALVMFVASGTAVLGAEQVAVVTGVIYPGQTITEDKIRIAQLRRTLSASANVARTSTDLVGQVARRTILPDRLIDLSAVRQANLVEVGKPVRVNYRSGALSISMTAVSLTAGAAGEIIKLRNATSGKVFAGVVMDDGTVWVGEGL